MAIRARWALAGAVGCIVLLAATWFAAFHVGIVRDADQSMFAGFYDLHSHGAIPTIANFVAPLCSPNPYVYFARSRSWSRLPAGVRAWRWRSP
jgi:hypothetical protein